jgi:hypothetical protein
MTCNEFIENLSELNDGQVSVLSNFSFSSPLKKPNKLERLTHSKPFQPGVFYDIDLLAFFHRIVKILFMFLKGCIMQKA